MPARSDFSSTLHYLLSILGSRWKDVHLAVFTVYIDDSGTDPRQHVAIASGLIIPSMRIPSLDREWDAFLKKVGIGKKGFHTSECVARNPKSDFVGWSDEKVKDVLARIRQMTFKYSVQAQSMAVEKKTFDDVIPVELRNFGGKYHYSWAVDHMGGFVHRWAEERGVNVEYIFDMAGKNEQAEITEVMEHAEALNPGNFLGHYAFRNRADIPALQCADLFAWTCYQQALLKFRNKPLPPFAETCWDDFSRRGDWCGAWTVFEPQLKQWVKGIYGNDTELARIRALIANR
jgi:Protein of unknown function (DUF3800)